MLTKGIMISSFPAITPEQHLHDVEDLVFEYEILHLPVLKDGKYVGMMDFGLFCTDDIENNVKVESIMDELLAVSIEEESYIFDGLNLICENELSAIAVVNTEGNFVGLVRDLDILNYLRKTISISHSGSFITLKLLPIDYNLQEISRIVESNNARIISLHIDPIVNQEEMLVTLKIDKRDLSHILATFERFGYNYVAHSSTGDHHDDMMERYELLMRYLNL